MDSSEESNSKKAKQPVDLRSEAGDSKDEEFNNKNLIQSLNSVFYEVLPSHQIDKAAGLKRWTSLPWPLLAQPGLFSIRLDLLTLTHPHVHDR